jgi:glucosyl-3-phosphoglycerate synthase
MAFCADLARTLPTPTDWGLEIGTLAEVHRRVPSARVCQVEVADVYEHKHKPLSADSASQGLHRMALEVGAALFRAIEPDQIDPVHNRRSDGQPTAAHRAVAQLQAHYREVAHQLVGSYRADARLNGLTYDLEAEQQAVSVFAGAIPRACELAALPGTATCLAPWTQVEATLPRALDRLRAVADETDTMQRRPAPRVPVGARVARLIARRAEGGAWAPTPALPTSAVPAEDFA